MCIKQRSNRSCLFDPGGSISNGKPGCSARQRMLLLRLGPGAGSSFLKDSISDPRQGGKPEIKEGHDLLLVESAGFVSLFLQAGRTDLPLQPSMLESRPSLPSHP